MGEVEEVEVEVAWVEEEDEDVLLGPMMAAMVIAPEVPQHAVLFTPQHQVRELALLPQGLICALLFES